MQNSEKSSSLNKGKLSDKSNIEFNNEKFINNSHINGNGNGNYYYENGNGNGKSIMYNDKIIDLPNYKQNTSTSIDNSKNRIINVKDSNDSKFLDKANNMNKYSHTEDGAKNENDNTLFDFISTTINYYKHYIWAKPYLKMIKNLQKTIENINEENYQLAEFINYELEKTMNNQNTQNNHNNIEIKDQNKQNALTNISNVTNNNNFNNTNINNISNISNVRHSYNKMYGQTNNNKFIDKGGISVISSNEEVFNPFTNNQNLTNMTKFYDLGPDQIKARMANVFEEITKIVDNNNEYPEIVKQLDELNTKYGIFEFEEEVIQDNQNINNLQILENNDNEQAEEKII